MDHFTVASCVITGLVIFAIFSFILNFGRRRRHLCEQASKFPGPRTLPFIGNAHLFAGSNNEAILDKLVDLSKLYPTPYRGWLGSYLILVVNTPEQFKVILHSPKTIDRADFYHFARPLVGTGLLLAPAAKWRVHRKLIQPTFGVPILQSFVKIFSAQSLKMAKEMERNLDGPKFDIYYYTSRYALHAICETTMGVNLGTEANSNNLYAKALEKTLISMCRRMVSPWLYPNFIFHRTKLGKDQEAHVKFMHAFSDNVIETKKKKLLEQSRRPGLADSEEEISDGMPQRKIFVDHLLEQVSGDSKILSHEELRAEVDTIILTGSDTTAVASSYVMLMLASHPEVQDKVYRELCEIYGDNDSEGILITPEDLTRMTYLERVIKETLRLFPNVPFIGRSVTEDLDVGEHTFPAGSTVLLSILDLHRNGDIWPDPLKFDPDRFLPEQVQKRDSHAYLPFSGGPKGCIGSKYGMMSMKVFLSTILRKYVLKKDDITPVKDLRFKWEFVMRPVDPITLRIEKRAV